MYMVSVILQTHLTVHILSFPFCQIHQYMTGRIKLLKDDVPIKPLVDLPAIDYDYDKISDFDSVCGTHALEEFQLPHPECPEKFVCNVPGGNTELRQFANCIDAMDCHMIAGSKKIRFDLCFSSIVHLVSSLHTMTYI